MGTSALTVERTATDVDLTLSVSRNGGVTGLTTVVAIRDGDTNDSYLDFADQTFKTAGHTTREAAMTDIGGGHYRRALDLTAMTNLPAGTEELVAEYRTSGAVVVATHDKIQLVTTVSDASRSVHGSGGYDGVTLEAVFFGRRDGAVVAGTAASIRVFSKAGTALTAIIAATGPTADGVWRISAAATLEVNAGSYITVSITTAGGTIAGVIPIASQT